MTMVRGKRKPLWPWEATTLLTWSLHFSPKVIEAIEFFALKISYRGIYFLSLQDGGKALSKLDLFIPK